LARSFYGPVRVTLSWWTRRRPISTCGGRRPRQANLLDRIDFVEGDFVRRAAEIDAADIVTLDRVVCCYPDAEALVGLSAVRADKVYGLVLPRDRWLVRAALRVLNLGFRIRRKAYRTYAHPNALIDQLVAAAGLRPRAETSTFIWRVVVYDRVPTDPAALSSA
jgi:magnesium-protoporphyrin O-methyltransferase